MNMTMGRARRTWAALAVAGALGASALVAGPAAAQEVSTCTRGDAERITQVGIQRLAKGLAGHTRHGIVRSMEHCQVQVSLDGAHYTFTDDDVIGLQQTFFGPWRCFFDTPRESFADFELLEEQVWIAEVEGGVAGEATEVEMSMTPVKTVVFTEPLPGWEECFPGPATPVHYRTIGAVVDLPPGEYEVTYEAHYAGELFYTATVRITVLPD